MPVYVDPLINWGQNDAPKCFRNKPSCHMFADTLDELHAMAALIGLKREWFQNDRSLQHYDLTPNKRSLAVAFGVVELERREAVEKWRGLRKQPKDKD